MKIDNYRNDLIFIYEIVCELFFFKFIDCYSYILMFILSFEIVIEKKLIFEYIIIDEYGIDLRYVFFFYLYR